MKSSMSDKEAITALMGVRYIGIKRAQALMAAGVADPDQLRAFPEAQLAAIKAVGPHYARLIKNELNQASPDRQRPNSPRAISAAIQTQPNTRQQIKRCRKRLRKAKKALKNTDEQLKPLWRRKYTLDYLAYKKTAKTARKLISKVNRRLDDLPPRQTKMVTAEAKQLLAVLDTVPSKAKRKHYKKAIVAVQHFNKTLTKGR